MGFGSGTERVVLISIGLGLALWGLKKRPIYVLAAMAWVTVAQRMLRPPPAPRFAEQTAAQPDAGRLEQRSILVADGRRGQPEQERPGEDRGIDPRSRLVVYEGVGHIAHWEQPERRG